MQGSISARLPIWWEVAPVQSSLSTFSQGLVSHNANCIHRMRSGGYYGFSGGTPPSPPPPQCVDDFLLPLYSKKYLQYSSQIYRIGLLIQKLASYCFWPPFEKTRWPPWAFYSQFSVLLLPLYIGVYAMYTFNIFRICLSCSKLPWELFWISLQNQDGRHGGFFDRLFTKYKKCEYLENRKI